MATKDSDEMMPRALPKPFQLEEICTRPEVPEVSLVFDASLSNSTNYRSSLCTENGNVQANIIEQNQFFPSYQDRQYAIPSNLKYLGSSTFSNGLPKTPGKFDNHGFPAPRKVSFSPQAVIDSVDIDPISIEHQLTSNGNSNGHHNLGTTFPQHSHTSRLTPDKKSGCSCSSYDNCDYSLDHFNANYFRMLKNLERKINTKVSYDDLQKTELKIENILLKHKCKYDKIGENCINKDEFSKVVQKYENQINLLQLRLDELTKKLSHSMNVSPYNQDIKKCNCSENQNIYQRNHPISIAKCLNSCCPHVSNFNERCPEEVLHYEKMSHNDRIIQKQTELNVQITSSDQPEMNKQNLCHKKCCYNHNSKNIEKPELQNREIQAPENHSCHPVSNVLNPPNQQNHHPTLMSKSNSMEQLHEYRNKFRSVNSNHNSQEVQHDNQLIGASEKNIRVDWAVYNNIVEDVKNLIDQNPNSTGHDANMVDLIKKTTMEQLQKMGISMNTSPDKKDSGNLHCPKKAFTMSNTVPSPDLSFHLNSLAMKYVSDTPSQGEYYNKKSAVNDVSFRSNGNNVSIATLQYMERYHLLPNSDQRHGGNSVECNKYEQNISQEHRHKIFKQTQNNDRSFVFVESVPNN